MHSDLVVMHYGSHGGAECGAHGDGRVPEEFLTKDPDRVTCPTCRGWLPVVHNWKPNDAKDPRRDLAWRLGCMADAMVSAKVGPQARFFTRERVDEIVLLLREAEKRILEAK